jgi:3-oxoadipate enol-lactonase
MTTSVSDLAPANLSNGVVAPYEASSSVLPVPSFTISGPPSGPPVVLLHPLGTDRHMWDALIEAMPQRRVLTYDFPGHGDSPVTDAPFDVPDLSRQLHDLLTSADIGNADIVGMSLGGTVALHFAATYPDLTRSVVPADCVPSYPEGMRAMFRSRADLVREHGVTALVEDLLAIWFTPEAITSGAEPVEYARRALSSANAEGYATACEALTRVDLRSVVGSIASPALVICGRRDLSAMTESAAWLASTIPRAHLSWLPGAHSTVTEHAAEFSAVLDEFLDGRGQLRGHGTRAD